MSCRNSREGWPFPPVGRPLFSALGLALLALCLFPFWGSIAVAAIFAFGIWRPLQKAREKTGLGARVSALALIFGLLVALLLPVTMVGLRVYKFTNLRLDKVTAAGGAQGNDPAGAFEDVKNAYTELENKVARWGEGASWYESTADARAAIRQNLQIVGANALKAFSGALLTVPDLVVSTLVFALFLYMFLVQGRAIGELVSGLGVMRASERDRVVGILQATCRSTIVTNVILGAIQATIVSGGATIFGYHEAVLIFTLVFFLSFIPFIGASPPAFLLAGASFLTGHAGNGWALLMVGLVAGSIDNVLRPFLISADSEVDVHPVLSFAGILGAIAVFGVKGLFLGPVIVTATACLLLCRKGEASTST